MEINNKQAIEKTTNLDSHPLVSKFLQSIKKNELRMLTQNNTKKFNEAFGRPKHTFNDDGLTSVWTIPFRGHFFYVVCNKTGTSFLTGHARDTFISNPGLGATSICFLQNLLKKVT